MRILGQIGRPIARYTRWAILGEALEIASHCRPRCDNIAGSARVERSPPPGTVPSWS